MVSAIITTHNRSTLLRRAIESVLSQTYTEIECIVVDDKSTDDTKEVCASYPSVQYIYIPPEESKGGNYARNKGIYVSKGEYVAFLDDDDAWMPTKIEEQMNVAQSSKCNLIYCGWRVEDIAKNGEITYIDELPHTNGRGDFSKRIFERIPATTSELLINRELIMQVGCFDENLKFWQEYELLIRLAQETPFDYANAPLIIYRRDQNDEHRLTNKYEGWKQSVNYISKKHRNLISDLSYIQRLRFRLYVSYEDMNRSKSPKSILFKGQMLYMRVVSKLYKLFNK